MFDFDRIRRFRSSSAVQSTIDALNDYVDRVELEAEKDAEAVADLRQSLGESWNASLRDLLDEMRPSGLDIPSLVVYRNKPIGWAKIVIREDEPSITGLIFSQVCEAKSLTEFRKYLKAFSHTILDLTDIAFNECGLSVVFVYVSDQERAKKDVLEKLGFSLTGDRTFDGTTPVHVYSKKKGSH